MLNINRIILAGNITKQPEITRTNNGSACCRLTLAYNEPRNGEKIAYFFNVVTFGTTAENCAKYLKKGSGVIVEGKLTNRTFKTKEGTNKTTTEILASTVNFLTWDKKEKDTDQPQQRELDY